MAETFSWSDHLDAALLALEAASSEAADAASVVEQVVPYERRLASLPARAR